MIRKIVDFDKLRGYPQSSYAFLWVILCVVVALVHLTAAAIITKSTDLQVSAASGSANLAVQNTVLPPSTPVLSTAPVCALNAASVSPGGNVVLTGKGFPGFTYTVKLLGLQTTRNNTLGQFNGISATFTIPQVVPSGVYTVRVYLETAGDDGVVCSPDLMVK